MGEVPRNDAITTLKQSLCGGAAYVVSEYMFHPVDTVRARVMAESGSYIKPVKMARRMYEQEGLRSFVRAINTGAVGAFVSNGIYFYVYEHVKSRLSRTLGLEGASFWAASIGQLAFNTAYLPFDLVRTRMQVPSAGFLYRSLADAVRTILKKDGVKGLYIGWRVWILYDAFTTGVLYGFYEHVKTSILRLFPTTDTRAVMLSSAAAYLTANAAMNFFCVPFNVVITRIQLASIPGEVNKLAKAAALVRRIAATEGPKGFFKGWSARLLVVSLSNLVSLPTYEALKLRFGVF